MHTKNLLLNERKQLKVGNDQSECHLIFGALGQDGSYLSEMLALEGKRVVGVIKPTTTITTTHLNENIRYVRGDIFNPDFVTLLFETYSPTHIYNLASVSSVADSYAYPEVSKKINLNFVQMLIDIMEKYRTKYKNDIYLLQASSSEMFGPNNFNIITEQSRHDPRSPYAEHKSMAHKLCLKAREEKNLSIGTSILFNHESPRRPIRFVSRKITRSAYMISKGVEKKLIIGNIKILRDWGYAPDYVKAMKIIVENSWVNDFVIATGVLHSLEEMCEIAFDSVGLSNYLDYIQIDQNFFRANENSGLVGDSSRLRQISGWSPTITFAQMVRKMVLAEN